MPLDAMMLNILLYRCLKCSVLFTCACVLLTACTGSARDDSSIAPSDRILEFSSKSNEVVIALTLTGGLSTEKLGTTVRIYGDGRLQIHYPLGSKRGGDWAGQVSRAEMTDLLNAIADWGILEFEAKAVEVQKQDVLRARSEAADGPVVVGAVSDAAIMNLEIFLTQYSTRDRREFPQENYSKEISWYAVDFDASQFPEIEALTNLSKTIFAILNLEKIADIRKMENK